MDAKAAFAFYQSGQFDRAEQAARSILTGSNDPTMRHLLGVLLCRRGQLDEGATELARALAAAPGNPAIRIMLVRALIDLGRGEEALGHALRPAPGPAAKDLWQSRAEAAEAAGAFPARLEALRCGALATIEAQLEAQPARADLLVDRARLLAVLRRDDEAIDAFRAMLAREPANLAAVRELGLLLERGSRLDELAHLVEDAERSGIEAEAIALLHALLSWRKRDASETLRWLAMVEPDYEAVRAAQLAVKAHDLLGNASAAIAAAERKNHAVADHQQWRGEAARFLARTQHEASRITPDWAATWTSPVVAGRPPVFLVGFPRSGTTLLDTFLMGHPDTAVLEEIPVLDMIAARVGPVDRLAQLSPEEIGSLRQQYLDSVEPYLPEGFAGVVIDKMPLNMLNAPLAHRLFPNASFIFAQRHPCDCVLSGYLQSFNLNPSTACFLDRMDAAALYDVAMESWTRSREAFSLQTHTIVYEDMVARPEAVLRDTIAFLGLDWTDQVLDHRSTAKARGAVSTASYDQVTEALGSHASGRWRRYREWLKPVLPLLLPWADRLGYED